MRVNTRHVVSAAVGWALALPGCLSNDVQLVENPSFVEQGPAGGGGGGRDVGAGGLSAAGSGGAGADTVGIDGGDGVGGQSTEGAGGESAEGVGGGAVGGVGGEGGTLAGAGGAGGDGGAAGSGAGGAGGTSSCESPNSACLTVAAPPRPCAGVAYSEPLGISGGTAPYDVKLVSPSGGELEPRQAEPAGEWRMVSTGSSGPAAGAWVEIEVTDSSSPPLVHTAELDLSLRSSCWLAYLSEGSPALTLVPISTLGEASGSKTLPAPEGQILDFEFSPDGQRLAARFRDAGGGQRLVVFDAPYWEESFTSAPGADVTHYEWAPDASTLAAAMTDGTGTALAGVGWPNGAGNEPVALAPSSIDVDSELFWIGSELLAFHRPDGTEELRAIGYARMSAAGFEEFIPWEPVPYSLEGLQLRASERGLFVMAPLDFGFDFIEAKPAGLGWTFHDYDVVPSPGFGHTAHALGGELLVYRAGGTAISTFAVPLPESAACERLLSWSAQGDRILCATSSSLDVLRVGDSGAQIDFGVTLHDGLAAFDGQRRVFSPGGRWLAFVMDPEGPADAARGFLFFANMALGGIDPNVEGINLTTDAQVNVAFSPDDRWSFLHIGPQLLLLPIGAVAGIIDVALEAPGACSEAPSDTLPTWCGAPDPGPIRWSPESNAAAVLTASGALVVVPAVPAAAPPHQSDVLEPSCGAACRYEFQPSINQEGF